jgi:tetratricopeptide (TPR) repeat protein
MPIRPKHTLGCRPAASRLFTDRDDFQELFHKTLRADRSDNPHVIVYYGVGGVGKTSLRRKLCETLGSDPGAVYSVVDFDIPAHRGQEMALSVLRREFRSRYKVPFNTFDIAYAVHWQKVKPDVALQKETFPFWEEGAIVADLVTLLGDVPAVGWIPKLAKIAGKGSRLVEQWWTKRGSEELRGLPALDAVQIAERLPMFWAADVRDYLTTKGVRGVVFLDTYEALNEGERSEGKLLQHDAWVRELVAQLPDVLWVICGREKLRWAEMDPEWEACLDQHLVGNLAVGDAEQFLVSCGIADPAIRAAIVEGSQGLPYYLDLAVDTYLQIAEAARRAPVSSDFARTPTDVFARFLRHLTQPEVETLKLLSIPRFWTRELFELLVKEFQTGYPITAFNDLCRFSFISEDAARGNWSMHQLMRQSLLGQAAPDLVNRVHRLLFEHYDGRLKVIDIKAVTDRQKEALAEAFYHGRALLQVQEFFRWFLKPAEGFEQAAQWRLLVSLYEQVGKDLEGKLGVGHPDVAECLTFLAGLLYAQSKYAEAEPLFRRALAIREKALGPEHPTFAESLNNLAVLLDRRGKYAEAEPLSRRALAIKEKALGAERHEVAVSLNNLACLLDNLGKYAEAELLFRRALAVSEKALGLDHANVAVSLNNLAKLLASLGRYAEAEPLFRRALAIKEKALGLGHPDVAWILNNLAVLLCKQGKYVEAETLARRALVICEETLGPEHLGFARSLNSLARLLTAQGQLAEAESLHLRALAIFEGALGPEHPDVADTSNSLAVLCIQQGRLPDAESLALRGLTIRESRLRPDHPLVAESLDTLADLCRKTGRDDEADSLAERAQAIRAKARQN